MICCPIPGYNSVSEFERLQGLRPGVVKGQMKRGYCRWPRQIQNRSGLSGHPYYAIFKNIVSRFNNPRHHSYQWYGGRPELHIHPEWLANPALFIKYVESLGARPPNTSLDRINNDVGYIPGNLRWATGREQCYNQRIRKDNTSGYRGISYNKQKENWRVSIYINNKRRYKSFTTLEEAVCFQQQLKKP